MMRLLYNLLFPLAFLAILPRYLARMFRRGGYRDNFGQRFARYSPALRQRFASGEWIWVHAVSVGELLVALKVIGELHHRHPAWRFAVSSTTSTAHALAVAKQQDWWVPIYTPVDLPPVVRRALDTVRPRAVILTESEMWPNFVWQSAARGLPVILVNARVSPRSARRYRRFAPILRSVTRHLTAVGLQDPEDAGLWEHLGVPRARLHLTGSVKYDPDIETHEPRDFRPVLEELGISRTDPVLLAGSTHDGEEVLLAAALRQLRTTHPHARLLIAPRHVERTPDILRQLAATGLRAARRTAPPGNEAPDILLIDTTGELRDWYACADLVFIGKSLCGTGGQNPVEAILAGRPVLFGPHMANFAALTAALLKHHGALQVRDADSLAFSAAALLDDRAQRDALVTHAATALQPHRGATARTADLIRSAVKGSDSPAHRV
jgi:3-deoxy-D-manno-octulosonic-acid transferase